MERVEPAFCCQSPFVDFSFFVGPNIDFHLFCEGLAERLNLVVYTKKISGSTHKRSIKQRWQAFTITYQPQELFCHPVIK